MNSSEFDRRFEEGESVLAALDDDVLAYLFCSISQ